MQRTFALVLLAAVAGCQTAPPAPVSRPRPFPNDGASALTPAHVGKRVRFQLATGGALMTATVREVRPESDTALVELNHGDETGLLSLRPSQVLWLEELVPAPKQPAPAPRREEPVSPEKRAELRFGGAQETDRNIRVVYVTFRHNHTHEACLLDMAQPLRENPSSVVFVDDRTKATLSVPVPADPDASLVAWQWHAHVVGGEKEKPADQLLLMNPDGQVEIDFKNVPLPASLLLVGTPMRVRHPETKIEALAPPRVVSLRLLKADTAEAVLRNNPEILTRVESDFGALWVAAQPASEGEMVLSLYDPAMNHAAVLPKARFAARESILIPAFTLDVANAEGVVWQRLGGYPIPPFLSPDTQETSEIHLEVLGKRLGGGIAAPLQVSVRVPERAAVKADVDVRFYGAVPKAGGRIILAHGRPGAPGKPLKFEPTVKDLDPAVPLQSFSIDLSKLPREAFPAQVFVWHHVAYQWKPAGGFLPAEPPLLGGPGKSAPKRCLLVYPAPCPHLKFIKFEGPAPDLDGSGRILGLAGFVPFGGSTLGTGGPRSPFSFQISSALAFRDDDDVEKWSRPHKFRRRAQRLANATATAWAIAHCGCGKNKGPCEEEDAKEEKKEKKQDTPRYEPEEPDKPTYADPDDYPVPPISDGEPTTSGPDPGEPRWTEPYAIFTPDVSTGY